MLNSTLDLVSKGVTEMQYRTFGKLDWQASVLGFGCMRLPVVEGDHAKIDETEATRMLRFAIDQGVNYLDSAYPITAGTASRLSVVRSVMGTASACTLPLRCPCWLIETPDDFDRYLDEQLERLQTDHIDFYLLHALHAVRWQKLRDLGVTGWAERAQADGRIGNFGFSFHDSYVAFKEIIDAYDGWAFCQIQYNYANTHVQAGTRGLRYAASKGLAVVVMEPLLGGKLANPPASVQFAVGCRAGAPVTCGLGAAMAVGSTRGFRGLERHVHHGAGSGQH